jgi:hypothetical protein
MMKTMLKALRVNHDGYQKGPKMGPNISPVVGWDMHFTTHDHDLDERHSFFFTTCTGSFRLILRAQYISRRDGSVD